MIIKWLLFCIVLIHGLIHLLGGFSELHIANFNNLSGKLLFNLSVKLRKLFGVLWILTTILFLTTAFGIAVNSIWWHGMLISAVVCSQILIMLWWNDAKFGSLVNLLLLIALYFIK